MSTTEPMTQEQLDAIRERLDKSSWTEHEPWAVYDDGLTVSVCVEGGAVPITLVANHFLRGEDNGEADACFTAHAPDDLADLLAEVERLRADNERLRALTSQCNDDLEYVAAQASKTAEQLRELTTMDDAMVERALRQSYGTKAWQEMCESEDDLDVALVATSRDDMRGTLNAALNPGEGS